MALIVGTINIKNDDSFLNVLLLHGNNGKKCDSALLDCLERCDVQGHGSQEALLPAMLVNDSSFTT